jgi:hypothetical protein
MNRITATLKELVAEVIGDGNMFDKARQEKAMAGGSMIPPPNLRPMKDFNPAEPAILHDAVNNCIVTWDWERADHFRKNAVYDAEGRVAWQGYIFDGWGNVLGG